MPNKTIYLNTIKEFERKVGFSLFNSDEVAQKLQEAWRKDTTQAKLDYLAAYQEVFQNVLKKWSESELSQAFYALSETKPIFKDCLLKTDETLKLCAMSLIPELRENTDVLSNMTFGVIDSIKLKDEFTWVRHKYVNAETTHDTVERRKTNAYNRFADAWQKTTVRNIVAVVRDKDALNLMSQEEKIDYTLALTSYREDTTQKRPLDAQEKELIDDALREWKKEIGCINGESLDEFVANKYFNYAQKFREREFIEKQVNEAITEYNKEPNPAKREIEQYKKIEASALKSKTEKEHTIHNEGITDDTAEMVGDFFMQEELTQAIKETPKSKERLYLQENVEKFNQNYSLKMNHNKLRTSIEQLSSLMLKAQQEKQRFLDKNAVVVIENGKETCYDANDYYKEIIDEANKKYEAEIKKIEEERQRVELQQKELLNGIEGQAQTLGQVELEKLKANNEKDFKEKKEALDKAISKAKADLQENLSVVAGGIVVEKNGDTVRQYKASRYYETHETQKEQYAYGEYQKVFSRVYKDACKNTKEKNYTEGKVTDFSRVAKDVDRLLKSAMYISNIYENNKNVEIIQKCSFGGLSAEKLASFATQIEGDSWANEQNSETLWSKQVSKTKRIIAQWENVAKSDKKINASEMVRASLKKCLDTFNQKRMTQKDLLDYMLAGEDFLQRNYSTRDKRFFNRTQYNHVKNALMACRSAVGLTEHDSLRAAMNKEYAKMATAMSKEQIFKSVEKGMEHSLAFQDEKTLLEHEHKVVQDREIARKESELASLRAKDREPISIPELDERKNILTQEPRVKPIVPVLQQHGLRMAQ